jgi:hypothetical protein
LRKFKCPACTLCLTPVLQGMALNPVNDAPDIAATAKDAVAHPAVLTASDAMVALRVQLEVVCFADRFDRHPRRSAGML